MAELSHEAIDDSGDDLDRNQAITDSRSESISMVGEERFHFFFKALAEAASIPEDNFYRGVCSKSI